MLPTVAIFLVAYLGVALGHFPGLALDRTGIALLGAIAMIVAGAVTLPQAVGHVDLSTIILLYALMVVSAQLRLGGFYTYTAFRISHLLVRPRFFLLVSMAASAVLSAVLANDIVCLAFTPVLILSLHASRLNPLPFLLGLAVSSNIGSTATIIGNPQNMLIGQVGRLEFGRFILWCGPPALLALAGSFLLLCWLFRKEFGRQEKAPDPMPIVQSLPSFDRWQSLKGLAGVGLMLGLFFTSIPRELSAIAVAGALLCSRRLKSREILHLVDWHLITLFCSLFVIIGSLEAVGAPPIALAFLRRAGIDLHDLGILSVVSVVLSNLVSNVPAVMLLLGSLDPAAPEQWYALAASSTFAGNLITIGSIANLIVIEQASIFGVEISFREHARVGIPVTLFSLAVLGLWIYL
ncbi:SLC13 family permease [Desulfococcus sp.]|uniref:SLC13 family permease n=1 Tax=Desulfococcus sp. TaxID=2025834 RepID=UPI00359453C0